MRKTVKGILALAAGGGLAIAPTLAAGPAWALPSTVYVSPAGVIGNAGTSCSTAQYATIAAGMAAVATGGTVNVCHGVYPGDVLVTKALTLWGYGANINGTGKTNGIKVTAPNVTVRNFFVYNAITDGILVQADGAIVEYNTSNHNAYTGISLDSSSSSYVYGNTTRFNALGGITLADDAGITSNNTIVNNDASNNPGGCGIIMASHTSGMGVFDNVVRDNVADGNGTNPLSSGSGILMATGVPGGDVSGNLVDHNWVSGNGLAGVVVHGHVAGLYLNGNAITNNIIGTNNLDGDPIGLAPPGVNVPDPYTTGVLLASSSPLSITVANNAISDNRVGIWRTSLVKVFGINTNTYTNVLTPVRYAP